MSIVSAIVITLLILLLCVLIPFYRGGRKQPLHAPPPVHELADPFLAEVLLDGQPVATITDRVFTEMFWRDYKITPLTPELADVVMNDDLWEACRFTFRDPASLKVCRTAFCGGSRPFVRGGIVSLRALYFLTEDGADAQKSVLPAGQSASVS